MMRLALGILLLLAGCAPSLSPPSVTLVWSHDLAFGAQDWRNEVDHRFGDRAVIVVCHGRGDSEWQFVPDPPKKPESVQAMSARLRQMYPGRPIVLITCNPGGFELHGLPGVYYARRDVLVPPFDGDDSLGSRWRSRAAGTIWELADHP